MLRACVLLLSLAVPIAARAFDLEGHRGARGLRPENTLPAFAEALRIGVTTLELDLAMTRDGVLVVHHDIRLAPDTARGPGGAYVAPGIPIHSLTRDELARYDVGRLRAGSRYAASLPEQQAVDGTRIPTLDAVFGLVRQAAADQVRFNIETKLTPTSGAETPDPETFARAVVEAVRRNGMTGRVSVESFDWRTLKALAALAPEIPRVCLTSEGAFDTLGRGKPGPSPWTAGLDIDDVDGSTPRLVQAAGCAVWSPRSRDLTPESLAGAKALGLSVVPWTVNAPAEMERLIGLGVDGLITDYPDRLRRVLAERGVALPAPVPMP